MKYPSGFPQQSRAAVEAEELRASRDFEQAKQKLHGSIFGPGEDLAAEVRRYILRVYRVFVREACKLGGLWAVDRIRSHAREFLTVLTSKASSEKGYDTGGRAYRGQIRRLPEMTSHVHGAILPEVLNEFEKSVHWRESEDAVLKVAEAQAVGGRVRGAESIEIGQTVSPEVIRKRGRPAISPETKRKALEAKQSPGGTNKDAAKILYGTEYPTLRQVKNVPAILRYYQKSLGMKKS
jgi:hypothetical protein